MNIVSLLPFIVLIGAMFLMTRSAKNKQRQAAQMRDHMQPGTGVRTIGGMYATVKEVNDDTVLLEVAPGVHAIYAKNSIGAVLEDAEYNRIVHGIEPGETVVPDDVSSLTGAEAEATQAEETGAAAEAAEGEPKTDLSKKTDLGKETAAAAGSENPADKADQPGESAEGTKDAKRDGDADAK
ncbi:MULTISPECIES: preprotein translocase subunit YajC [Streptomyces]|uniref:Preprotein translocase subunit YajC n=1 Tax=Streptomyces morookaense TaxID=1970 RepID=A0A7Y7E951_STRMO|nr:MULTISPECIES: preprotein translocase subunit YajC [Streptomyces]MCC2276496.1 preprotein translocase subunit YajC [Streptomyces sp. ET3-23]NVK80715.1 preprotein translocase subunit YajC [Streptomyces morookaense]GHF51834.1 preprotein translocase subunit YajC [Streptomyces morookaense]